MMERSLDHVFSSATTNQGVQVLPSDQYSLQCGAVDNTIPPQGQ